ncbi:MAG: MFS transporter permease [Chloroflexi bacterium]|nr:MFS transporter permease [Chloroflexota bacterium]
MTSDSHQKPRFFSFPHPMNSSVARVVAAGVVVMSLATIFLDQPWITLVIAFGFITRFLAGPRISPLAILASRVIVPKFGLPYRPVAGPPKRFAAAIGILFSVTAAILSLGLGLNGIAYIVLTGLIFAASLESIFGYCLGCQIFGYLMKWGFIPENICEDCLDFEQRTERLAAQGLGPDGKPISN